MEDADVSCQWSQSGLSAIVRVAFFADSAPRPQRSRIDVGSVLDDRDLNIIVQLKWYTMCR
jgi:hypothetical protein